MKKLNRNIWIGMYTVALVFGIIQHGLARGMHYDANVLVEVVSDTRGILQKYDAGFRDNHASRSYVIARDNERYSIRIRNRNNKRIGVVIAVDGRNIISGKKSNLQPYERMYILDPYESATYEGWRTGRNRINQFYFTNMDDSYAAAWGDYTAMGVIAVAVYEGRHKKMYKEPDKFRNNPFERPRSNARRQDPGTGFGETEWSPSRVVHFEPESRPLAKEYIKYEWRSTLCKRGIIQCRKPEKRMKKNRFWPDHSIYAPFPPKWQYR